MREQVESKQWHLPGESDSDQIEIERKWLISQPGPILELLKRMAFPQTGYLSTQHIVQLYLDLGESGIRLRDTGLYRITVKGEGDVARKEWEVEIPDWVFAQLAPAASGRIVKTRNTLEQFKGRTWEIDVFEGDHDGLILVETEVIMPADASPDAIEAATLELKQIVLPVEFGPPSDVTDDKRYKNKNLALYGMPDEEDKA